MATRMESLVVAAAATLLTACATPPASEPREALDVAPAQTDAANSQRLEKKFQEAARGYRVVQKEGRTLYCKRERVLGSTIPTLQCLSEAQLRLQVENMEELRGRMRSGAKCTLGRDGGGGGGCGGS
jgi:hypothetical protein